MIYLRCPKHKSAAQRPLSACLCRCTKRCDAFRSLSDAEILEFLDTHDLPATHHGFQLRLFQPRIDERAPALKRSA